MLQKPCFHITISIGSEAQQAVLASVLDRDYSSTCLRLLQYLAEITPVLGPSTEPFKAQQKIYYNIFKVEEGVMKVDIFKKLENTNIWEFRTLYNGICYRLFSFWDTEEETLVIATHGIIKKTQKTPLKEIAKAEEIRKEYFNNKKK